MFTISANEQGEIEVEVAYERSIEKILISSMECQISKLKETTERLQKFTKGGKPTMAKKGKKGKKGKGGC